MNLQDALKTSTLHKACIHHENVTTIVEQGPNGYDISYSGKQRHYTTFDALSVFLGQEVVKADWTPLAEEPMSEDEAAAKRRAYNQEMDERNQAAAENREKPWLPLQPGEEF